jgi:8-oxo-dGTP diphosphatase
MTDNVREFLNKEFENHLIKQASKENISRFVVGGLICNDQKHVLVLKRASNDFLGGLDELLSGKVEKGERLYEALIREIKEETNLKVIEPVKRYIGHFDYKSKSGILTRQFNFEVLVEDVNQIKISEEHESYNWYSDVTKDTLNFSENVINVINNFFPPPQKRQLSCESEKNPKKAKIKVTSSVFIFKNFFKLKI